VRAADRPSARALKELELERAAVSRGSEETFPLAPEGAGRLRPAAGTGLRRQDLDPLLAEEGKEARPGRVSPQAPLEINGRKGPVDLPVLAPDRLAVRRLALLRQGFGAPGCQIVKRLDQYLAPGRREPPRQRVRALPL